MSTIDLDALRAYRYERVQQQLVANDCAAAVLANPVLLQHGKAH